MIGGNLWFHRQNHENNEAGHYPEIVFQFFYNFLRTRIFSSSISSGKSYVTSTLPQRKEFFRAEGVSSPQYQQNSNGKLWVSPAPRPKDPTRFQAHFAPTMLDHKKAGGNLHFPLFEKGFPI